MRRVSSSLLLTGILMLAACDTAELSETATAPALESRSTDECINVRASGTAPLEAPVFVPVPPFAGGGGLPATVEFGTYTGQLSSVLVEEEQAGNGALKYRLVHYFNDGAGNTFWTDDRAVCSPVQNDPSVCRLNDRLAIDGGTGAFADASGFLQNHGLITFTAPTPDPVTGVLTFGTLDFEIHGRICGDG